MMTQPRPVLDLRVRVESLHDREKDIGFTLPEASFGALAKVIGVDKVLSCEAELHLIPDGSAVDVTGFVRAKVTQTCVVTLELFDAVIDEPVDVRFAPLSEIEAAMARHVDDEGEEGSLGMADAPEPIEDGVMDLGALLQEFLALGVDPYPRKPDVAFDQPAPETGKPSPFAALARLQTSRKEPG